MLRGSLLVRDRLRHTRTALFAFAIVLTGAGCRGDVKWTDSDGDVAGGSYRLLDYEVTSERYRQWIAAHRALDGVEIGEPVSVDLRNLTEKDIERVEETLANHAAARASIESAGMSVRDFVLTTIALAQPWAESSNAVTANVNVADPGPTVTRRPPSPQPVPIRVEDDDDSDSDSDDGKRKKKGRKKGRG